MRLICLLLLAYLSWASSQTVTDTVQSVDTADNTTVPDITNRYFLEPNRRHRHSSTDAQYKERVRDVFGSPSDYRAASSTIPSTTTDAPEDEDPVGECYTSAGKAGVCVPFYQCNQTTGTVIRHGFPVLEVRFGALNCPNYIDRCCLLEQTMKKRDLPEVPQNKTCGWSNPGAQSFRINSNEFAEFGEFPWIVAILNKISRFVPRATVGGAESWQGDYLGGGSIIHPSVVLTAAHKVHEREAHELKCRGGEWDTLNDKEIYPYQERYIKKIIRHESFDRTSLKNNVALLILEAPYDLSHAPHMGVACIAPQLPPSGKRCQSMGWGKEFYNSTQYAVLLKKVELPLVHHDKCQKTLKKNRLVGRFFLLEPTMTCAGGEAGRDTCQGDGGSPLVCPIEETESSKRFAITALVASGLSCGLPVPAVYVDVTQFYNWIGEHMQIEGFGNSSYTY